MAYLVIFKNARDVIRLNAKCEANGLKTKVIPVPQQYSSACGMSLEVCAEQLNTVKELACQLNIEISIYEK